MSRPAGAARCGCAPGPAAAAAAANRAALACAPLHALRRGRTVRQRGGGEGANRRLCSGSTAPRLSSRRRSPCAARSGGHAGRAALSTPPRHTPGPPPAREESSGAAGCCRPAGTRREAGSTEPQAGLAQLLTQHIPFGHHARLRCRSVPQAPRQPQQPAQCMRLCTHAAALCEYESLTAVASWYCWYSATRSFMLLSASVNCGGREGARAEGGPSQRAQQVSQTS